jgi:hypothetical protein
MPYAARTLSWCRGERRGRTWTVILLIWGIVQTIPLAVPHVATAMVVVKRDFPELVARADAIVVGTVRRIEQGADPSGAPATFVTFSDLTVLKGEVGESLTLRFFGGAEGDVVTFIPDMPTFTVGERDAVFVAGNGRDVCPLVGIWQGRFRVRFDAERGTDIVEDSNRTPVVGRIGRRLLRSPSPASTAGSSALSLGDFLELVADELDHPTTPDVSEP